MKENFVDARGLSCPEPVLMAKDALKEYSGKEFTIAVSSPNARDNVLGLIEGAGRKTAIEEKEDGCYIKVLS
ncbi:sulfurtransferase TusA family protein [Anaeropeptidivorans aminofermentans]|jgi:TusA-related sulfurtransferase|uniref:sulfurtransferase TusA family protein n=1 Tax=Anaeropeptidivorans aminofermentans TaxID=2934315 RepID=UPI0020254D0C|nr:sulfurtransferase TusA family protein [Anaeropeptidivorans aminofermentans]MBE6012058.1 preprotein translocase subunit TatB [Lachnospiraceae bacterium]